MPDQMQRPPRCPYCDSCSGADVLDPCRGVCFDGFMLFCSCVSLRAHWDAGYEAGRQAERAAQALDTEESYGKEWV